MTLFMTSAFYCTHGMYSFLDNAPQDWLTDSAKRTADTDEYFCSTYFRPSSKTIQYWKTTLKTATWKQCWWLTVQCLSQITYSDWDMDESVNYPKRQNYAVPKLCNPYWDSLSLQPRSMQHLLPQSQSSSRSLDFWDLDWTRLENSQPWSHTMTI